MWEKLDVVAMRHEPASRDWRRADLGSLALLVCAAAVAVLLSLFG